MLEIIVPEDELYDEQKNEFIHVKDQKLQLEHSLIAISKWESKWNKPFLSNKPRTHAESIDYIRCMTLTQNIDPNVYKVIGPDIMKQIDAYIDSPMTATTINDYTSNKKINPVKKIYTSELIYYLMISYGIPFECQKWHLNRLLMLIDICGVHNQGDNKMSTRDRLQQQAALNEARRKQWNTKG